jgi:hypothetical protein
VGLESAVNVILAGLIGDDDKHVRTPSRSAAGGASRPGWGNGSFKSWAMPQPGWFDSPKLYLKVFVVFLRVRKL